MVKVGQYLRAVREARQLSLGDVEKSTEITTTRLNRIEHGSVKEPSPIVLKQLASLYGINIISLFIKAGYLDEAAVSAFPKIFSGVENLNEDELNHIQREIDFINGLKNSCQREDLL